MQAKVIYLFHEVKKRLGMQQHPQAEGEGEKRNMQETTHTHSHEDSGNNLEEDRSFFPFY